VKGNFHARFLRGVGGQPPAPSRSLGPMKSLVNLIPCVAIAVGVASCSSPGWKSEVDSPSKAFLEYGIRAHAEAYLVCLWAVEKTSKGDAWAAIQATVVENIKGSKKIGENFTFERMTDTGVWDFAYLRGGLYYLFIQKGLDGRGSVDAQDPGALWQYSDVLRKIVEQYKKKS
jgi:hypothetical protein